MSDAIRDEDNEASWDDVGERFKSLGQRLQQNYEKRAEGVVQPQSAPKPTEALKTLVGSIEQAFSAVGDTVKDPTFRKESNQALATLGDALGEALSDVGQEVRERFKSTVPTKASPTSTTGPAPEPQSKLQGRLVDPEPPAPSPPPTG